MLKEIELMKHKLNKSKGIPNILKKHLSKNYNGKFIIFCKDKIHLDEMKETVVDWFKQSKVTKQVDVYSVYSNYEYGDAEVEAFIENKNPKSVKLLFSIEMFNEGIHIEDVTGVILLRPTVSPIIYYQQIGRAMQAGKNNTPVIFDLVNNFDNIGAKNFIDDLEKEVKLENDKLDKDDDKGDDEEKGYVDISEFMIFDETREAMDLFSNIEDKLIDNWDAMYLKLEDFYIKYGHSDVILTKKGLGNWVHHQRNNYKNGLMSNDRIEKLNNFNFAWSKHDCMWKKNFKELKDFYLENNCFPTASSRLGYWVQAQRKNYDSLSIDEINLLNSIEFKWKREDNWSSMFSELNNFKILNGHCDIVRNDNVKLYRWKLTQKKEFYKNNLSSERIAKLTSLDTNFFTQNNDWQFYFERYVKFLNSQKTLTKKENDDLYTWEINQRAQKKSGKLSEEKIKLLDEINFNWIKGQEFDESLSLYHIKNLMVKNKLNMVQLFELIGTVSSKLYKAKSNKCYIPSKYVHVIAEIFKINHNLLEPQKRD